MMFESRGTQIQMYFYYSHTINVHEGIIFGYADKRSNGCVEVIVDLQAYVQSLQITWKNVCIFINAVNVLTM